MRSVINPWKIPSSGPMLRISYGKLRHPRKLNDDDNIVKDDNNMVKDNNNMVRDEKKMVIKTSKMFYFENS